MRIETSSAHKKRFGYIKGKTKTWLWTTNYITASAFKWQTHSHSLINGSLIIHLSTLFNILISILFRNYWLFSSSWFYKRLFIHLLEIRFKQKVVFMCPANNVLTIVICQLILPFFEVNISSNLRKIFIQVKRKKLERLIYFLSTLSMHKLWRHTLLVIGYGFSYKIN